nr:type ISP restriction/modification enzyme [Xylanibacter muris]
MVKDYRFISSQKLEWQIITPNEKADWINQRDGVFDNLIPLAHEKKFALNAQSVFSTYAIGVATNRDAWVSGFSKDKVTSNMRSMIDFYNQQIDENKLSTDTTKISWTVNLKKDHESKVRHSLKENAFVETFYRPFNRINLYYHRPFIERPGIWRQLFPTSSNTNLVIAVSGIGQQKPFASLITDSISDLQVVDKANIIYNDHITIENIPLKAYDYVVNGKSAIEWIMERYAVTIDKASQIKNDPNDWSREHKQPRYILDLLLSVIMLSCQTVDIVNTLPILRF